MEPHREEQSKALELGAEPKPKRFRIVKLEERIAPSRGGGTHANTCANCPSQGCTWSCTCEGCATVHC
jgi:hypothetical protein